MPDPSVPTDADRIVTLDIVRGVAVMGILAMNIVAFAMPFEAYMNPLAYGLEGPADIASWAFNFVFVDGKMRGLFSFLFGASCLLVIERAEAGERAPEMVHYARMLWLLLFGLLHFYFIWFGDILALYALVGLVLFFFRNHSVRGFIVAGVGLVLFQTLFFGLVGLQAITLSEAAAAPNADPGMVDQWQSMQRGFTPLTGQPLAEKLALFRGPWSGLIQDRLITRWSEPLTAIFFVGAETLAYMLFGMAALKSGLLRGDWPIARYRKWALICLGIAIPVYALLAFFLIREQFPVALLFALSLGATTPIRPIMVIGIAALIVVLTRHRGALVARISAAGRAAFTNYLGTSILMTSFFYGYGLGFYGTMRRVELWLIVLAMWALMLLWSKPWLDRFRYGPFEWLWRSLARWRLEPMRRAVIAAD